MADGRRLLLNTTTTTNITKNWNDDHEPTENGIGDCYGDNNHSHYSSHKCCPKQLQLPMFLSSKFFLFCVCVCE